MFKKSRTITKGGLDELAKKVAKSPNMSIITGEEMRGYVGGWCGGDGTPGNPFAQTTFQHMWDHGTWTGGFVWMSGACSPVWKNCFNYSGSNSNSNSGGGSPYSSSSNSFPNNCLWISIDYKNTHGNPTIEGAIALARAFYESRGIAFDPATYGGFKGSINEKRAAMAESLIAGAQTGFFLTYRLRGSNTDLKHNVIVRETGFCPIRNDDFSLVFCAQTHRTYRVFMSDTDFEAKSRII